MRVRHASFRANEAQQAAHLSPRHNRVASLTRESAASSRAHEGKAQRHLARLTSERGRPLAVATRRRRLVTLRSLLRFVAREEWLAGDLGTTIDLPRLPERLPKPLEADAQNPRSTRCPGAHSRKSGIARCSGSCSPPVADR